MKILGIETSCDETAISVLEAQGGLGDLESGSGNLKFNVLSSIVLSQAKLHEKYGGVFPNLAKREHVKNIVPVLEAALKDAGLFKEKSPAPIENFDEKTLEKVQKLLEHEEGLYENLLAFVAKIERPEIDQLAVTYGPGLEPALWVGLNTAKALGLLWNIPIIPVNHMEGHICSVLLGIKDSVKFPAIALLISGGHTELVLIEDWLKYKIVGETKDDAVGEAFDKVARMMNLPYPGGPEISRLAEEERLAQKNAGKNAPSDEPFHFPRPMLNTPDLNFSFSGLKTAVLYAIKKIPDLNEAIKKQIARAFEDAVVEVLVKKTARAIEEYGAKSLVIAGGVIANKSISEAFKKMAEKTSGASGEQQGTLPLFTPASGLSGDNAVMIALCAYIHAIKDPTKKEKAGTETAEKIDIENLKATGNLRLG